VVNPSGVQIGAVLAGRYRVDRVLGQGGMGIVVQAMHLQLHTPVAMKFLLPEVLANQQIVQRFFREAQAAVRLKSEHVARVIDVGSLETGVPYMVLEYLEGTDLASFPRSQLTVGGIIDLMLQACEALAEAHSLGIVHRDIKPANFFITRLADGTLLLKVLDFGISKAPMTGGPLTATQTVMGTPAYMSPEQMRSSRDVDLRSDIWSLGAVLYELLQGAPPFGSDAFSSMVIRVMNGPLPKLTVRLPGDLDAVIYRCLEKDAGRRFRNTAEVAQALARYAHSETQAAISVQRTRAIVGIAPRVAIEPGSAQRAPSTISGSAGARTMLRGSRRRWPTMAGMGVMAAIVVIALAASRGGRSEGQVPSARPEGTPKATSEPALGASTPSSRPPSVTTPGTSPASVTTAPSPAPPPAAAPLPRPVATAPPAPAPANSSPMTPVAALQATPPRAVAAAPESTTTATPSNTKAKKSSEPRKTSVSPASREASSKKPPAAEDDVFDTRN
jgi:serine/threonine-protein kinase